MNTGLDRLRILVEEVLPKVQPEEFDISSWLRSLSTEQGGGECGTVAGVVGHACLYKPFQELGLRLNDDDVPTYRGLKQIGAVERFFGLSTSEACYLFFMTSYRTEEELEEDDDAEYVHVHEVIVRIKQFIEQKEKQGQYERPK